MATLIEDVRAKYPVYKDMSDDDLALSIADKYPVYLDQDKEFADHVGRVQSQRFIAESDIPLAKLSGAADVKVDQNNPANVRTILGNPKKNNVNPEDLGFWEYMVTPFLEHTALRPDESPLGNLPDKVPTGEKMSESTGLPRILTVPASGAAKAAAGVGQFLTSPIGVGQTVTSMLPGVGILQRASWVLDMAKGAVEQSGGLSVRVQEAMRNPDQVKPDDWQAMAEGTANTALMLYGAGKLGAHEVSALTGIRAPVGRFLESDRTRYAKDAAEQLMKAEFTPKAEGPTPTMVQPVPAQQPVNAEAQRPAEPGAEALPQQRPTEETLPTDTGTAAPETAAAPPEAVTAANGEASRRTEPVIEFANIPEDRLPSGITADILGQPTVKRMETAIAKHEGTIAEGFLNCDECAGILSQALELKGIPHQVVEGKVNGESHQWVRVAGKNYDATKQGFAKKFRVVKDFTGTGGGLFRAELQSEGASGRPNESLPPAGASSEKESAARSGDVSEATRTEQPQPAGGKETVAPAAEVVKPVRVGMGMVARTRFDNETAALEGQDILAWVSDHQPLASKTEARRTNGAEWWAKNGSLYDDAPGKLPPHHNIIYKGGNMPDVVAEAAYRDGMLKSPDVGELWRAIRKASDARNGLAKASEKFNAAMDVAAKEHTNWLKATKKGELRVTADDLVPGDVLEVAGERVKVKSRDPDTGDIVLEDGKKFGVQKLEGGESIYVEKLHGVEGHVDWNPEPALPKLRPGEKGTGDLLSTQTEAFALAGEKGTDADRIAAEKVKAAADAKTSAELAAKNQGDMFGAKPGRVSASGASAPRTAPPTGAALSRHVPAAVAATPPVQMGPVRTWLAARLAGFNSIFAPQNIDAGAGQVANIMRELLGEKANNLVRAEAAMHELRSEFDKTPVPNSWTYQPGAPLPHNYAIIDALERNRAALPDRYKDFAKYFDDAFAWRIQAIQKFAPNALQHLIENYFPHIWTDPKRAAGVMEQVGTRLFAGRKEFLKQRSLAFFADGIERGLKPISDNPVDLLLAKLHSMDKFLVALKAQAEFKAIGKMKFKYALEKMPEGWVRMDDPSFVVNAPPMVTIKEAFDAQLRSRTIELLAKLGVPNERLATLGGQRWGLAFERPQNIQTRFGGPESVYWHELGHILDYRYDLQNDFLKQGKSFDNQLRALADQRFDGSTPPKSFKRYVRKAEEKMAVMLEAYTHAPDIFRRVAPEVFQKFDQFITDHPELHDIRNLKPSLRLGTAEIEKSLPGVLKLGDWIMPEGPAQVIKNYLSPGLSSSGAYRFVRGASNMLNAAQLGLSAFHVGFTSLDAIVNSVEVGLYRAIHKEPLKGAAMIAKSPLAPWANYYTGKAIQEAMINPHARTVKVLGMNVAISHAAHTYADIAVKAGMRATVDPFWQTHQTRNLMRSIHQGGLALAKTPLQLPLAIVEQTMRPIAEYLVPRQKLGVFSMLAKSEMDRLTTAATPVEVRAALARAANATEDRMGQMTYDNLFYNRMAKDLALIAFRAYGWQLGKYRHVAGAVADTAKMATDLAAGKIPDLTHRQMYFVALPLVVGAIGGMLHYMFTGKAPQSPVDYLHPSTGQQDQAGNEKRLSLPSYLKDLESDYHAIKHGYQSGGPLGVTEGLWNATYHRANPWISETVDVLNNRDFFGTQIWNENDPLYLKMVDQAKFFGKNAIPFSIANAGKLMEGEHSMRDLALPFIGVVPANKSLSMSPAEVKAAEIAHAQASIGGRTREQAAHAEVLRDVVAEIRKTGGTTNDLSRADQATVRSRGGLTPFEYQIKKMSIENAMHVFDLGSPEEKATMLPWLYEKLRNQAKRHESPNPDYVRALVKFDQARMAAAAAEGGTNKPVHASAPAKAY